jgi:hypothetical protein
LVGTEIKLELIVDIGGKAMFGTSGIFPSPLLGTETKLVLVDGAAGKSVLGTKDTTPPIATASTLGTDLTTPPKFPSPRTGALAVVY